MSRLLEIEAFVAVAEHGSFVAAAQKLGVSSSYTSKLITRLERRLGARLIHRTTRRHTLTPSGERYLTDCQAAFSLLHQAEERVGESTSRLQGEIRVTAPTGLGLGVLSGSFNRFALKHPDVRLSISYLDRWVDLIGERFDLAVRAGVLPDSSLRARRLGRYCRSMVASPSVAEALGVLTHPGALRGVPAVVYSGHARPEDWVLSRGEQTHTLTVERRMASNNGSAVAHAVASGLGISFLPNFHTCDLERQGRLVRLLPEWGAEVPVHVIFPASDYLPQRVRVLIDTLVVDLAASGS